VGDLSDHPNNLFGGDLLKQLSSSFKKIDILSLKRFSEFIKDIHLRFTKINKRYFLEKIKWIHIGKNFLRNLWLWFIAFFPRKYRRILK